MIDQTDPCMYRRFVGYLFRRHVVRDANRLILAHGPDALGTARHARVAAAENGRRGHWTRVLAEVECRSGYRPW